MYSSMIFETKRHTGCGESLPLEYYFSRIPAIEELEGLWGLFDRKSVSDHNLQIHLVFYEESG